MFFKFSTLIPDDQLSYILVKKPGNSYDCHLGNNVETRKAVGKFNDDRQYEIVVYNDGKLLFDQLKKDNAASYVSVYPWLVCPLNLFCIPKVLHSTLYGVNSKKDLTDEQFNAPKQFKATIGPCYFKNPPTVLEELGFKYTLIDVEGAKEIKIVSLETIEPMSATVFLQKIYLGFLALTSSFKLDFTTGVQIEKYLKLSSTWLDKVECKKFIVRRLSNYQKSLEEKFETEDDVVEEPSELNEVKEIKLEKKLSLHEKRHQFILGSIKGEKLRILDLGSGEGKLLAELAKKFSDSEIFGIEANKFKINKIKRICGKFNNVILQHDNLLYPKNSWEKVNVVIASEVIEHLNKSDRSKFIDLILNLSPDTMLLTTPNIAYNIKLELKEGELRHYDHKIEYTTEQFNDEVVNRLNKNYEVKVVPIFDNEEIQPSFCLVAERKSNEVKERKFTPVKKQTNPYHDPLYLDSVNYQVREKELRMGYTSYPFLANSHDIFYLGPTVAPTDWNDSAPDYLEHPLGCFEYYQKRGITKLIEEPKYMGSRGYILIFKSATFANDLGFDHPVIINSRSGSRFFDDKLILDSIHKDVASKMTDDFMILDAEILPWNIKAKSLITEQFRIPGEAALCWRSIYDKEKISNTKKFLQSLDQYSKDAPLEIRAFHLLASGKISTGGKNHTLKFEAKLGLYRSHSDQLLEIKQLRGDIVKAADHNIIDSSYPEDIEESIKRWEKYCDDGGEGFVYKPQTFLTYDESGYFRQPAVKVRGREYLRIIYGIDYLEPEFFNKLKFRGTKYKRILAIQEQELANRILRTFIHRNEIERVRAIGAFMGMDEYFGNNIDRTL